MFYNVQIESNVITSILMGIILYQHQERQNKGEQGGIVPSKIVIVEGTELLKFFPPNFSILFCQYLSCSVTFLHTFKIVQGATQALMLLVGACASF